MVCKCADDGRAGNDGVGREMWPRGVAVLPADGDRELVGGRHDRTGAGRDLAGREAGQVVHPVNLLDLPAIQQPVLDHGLAAAAAFFRGLEDDDGRAVKVTRLRKIPRGAEQHRRVAVMTAGVHAAFRFRRVRLVGLFEDRQRIHVGAQADHLAAAVAASANDADHARPAYPGDYFVEAESAQLFGNGRGRPVDLVEDLRVLVQVMPPSDDVVLEIGETVDDRHGELPAEAGL